MIGKKIIYSLAFRTFTPEGTIKAAAEMIPYLAETGFDILYLISNCKEDCDENQETWSPRQIASGYGNPKNPYKIKDYYDVDDEYGTLDDLKNFIEIAHNYGLKILIDLVFLHCGVNADFIKEHPNYVLRDDKGKIIIGDEWPFARINHSNPEVTEYFYNNMKFYIEKLCADGFRCDAGDLVPLSFWKETIGRLRELKPDIITLNEGNKKDYLAEAFDLDYDGFSPQPPMKKAFKTKEDLEMLQRYSSNHVNIFENHDTASNNADKRLSMIVSPEEYEQWLFLTYVLGGVPFIFNGNEIADDSILSMFSNRFYGKESSINWSLLQRQRGKKCLDMIRKLNNVYHNCEALSSGKTIIINGKNEDILTFQRKTEDETILIILNKTSYQNELDLTDYKVLENIILNHAEVTMNKAILNSYGCIAIKVK